MNEEERRVAYEMMKKQTVTDRENFIARSNHIRELTQKAQAFDSILEDLRRARKRTNLDEWKAFLDRTIRKFDWELILIGNHHTCSVCNKRLPMAIINWAYKKQIRWFCKEHYNSEKKAGNALLKQHDRSFKMMIKKNDGDVPKCQC